MTNHNREEGGIVKYRVRGEPTDGIIDHKMVDGQWRVRLKSNEEWVDVEATVGATNFDVTGFPPPSPEQAPDVCATEEPLFPEEAPSSEEQCPPLKYPDGLVKLCASLAEVTIPDVVGMLDERLADKLTSETQSVASKRLWSHWVGCVLESTLDDDGMPLIPATPAEAVQFYQRASLGKCGRHIRRLLTNGRLPGPWYQKVKEQWAEWEERKAQGQTPPAQQPKIVEPEAAEVAVVDQADVKGVVKEAVKKAEKPPSQDPWLEDAQADVYHQSAVNMILRCGYQYMYRYDEGIIRPPAVRMTAGSAGHKGVEVDLQRKIDTDELLPIEELRDAVADEYTRRIEAEGVLLDEEEEKEGAKAIVGRYKDRAIEQATAYHNEVAPEVYPTALERRFRVNVPGKPYRLGGTIDIQEPAILRDLKFTAKSPPRNAADISLQLTMYALAALVLDGEIPERLALDKVVKPPKRGPAYVKSLWTTRNRGDFVQLMRYVEWAHDTKTKGHYHPADPGHWCCSPRWCGYWDICPFGQRGRSRR